MDIREILELIRLIINSIPTIYKSVIFIKNKIKSWRIKTMHLNLFKPKKLNTSDKFSSNLFKFIKKNKEIKEWI